MRSYRERTAQYVIEGVRFLFSAANAGATIEGLVVCPPLLVSRPAEKLVERLRQEQVPVLRVDEATYVDLARLTEGLGRGVIAVVRQRWRRVDRLDPADLWLAVEDVRSPGNLGSLLRTCVAVGARGVIVVGDADPYDPSAVRATMGAFEGLELVRMPPAALVALVRRSGARMLAASPDGAIDYREASYRGATVLLVGAERTGVSERMRAACDQLVRIPMAGGVDSLNLAVAGSLVLYEAFGQRTAESART
jgi:RNA methyltransferase, TrmH family